MSLLLPGERPTRIWGAVLAAVAVLGLCALGCASPNGRTRRFTSVFQAARFEALRPVPAARDGGRRPAAEEGAAFVEKALHDAGFRFGTDLWVKVLYDFAASYHRSVINRDHLVQALVPLYRGKISAFLI